MKKIAIYTSFILASLIDIATFITGTSYIQLALAIILYLPLVYIAFRLFPRKTRSETSVPTISTPASNNTLAHATTKEPENDATETGEVETVDINKRAFLKILSATGLSFFISSLFSKRADTLIFGKSDESKSTSIEDSTGRIVNPAEHYPTDDYKISEVDYGIDTFYGFIDGGKNWFIMKEDINAGTYRYIKGSNNFHTNWNSRKSLKYDYFNEVFPKS